MSHPDNKDENDAHEKSTDDVSRVGIIDAANLCLRIFYRVAYQQRRRGAVHGEQIPYMAALALSYEILDFVRRAGLDAVYWVLEGTPHQRIELSEGEYKAHRKTVERPEGEKDDEIKYFDLAWGFLQHLPILCVRDPNREADDVAAHLALKIRDSGLIPVVLTADTDYLQLPADIEIWKQVHGNQRKRALVPPQGISRGEHYLNYKSLVGDSSDNIKGVKGIGKVRASRIVLTEDTLSAWKKDADGERLREFEHSKEMIRFREAHFPLDVKENVESGIRDLREAFTTISRLRPSKEGLVGQSGTWSSFEFYWSRVLGKFDKFKEFNTSNGVISQK